MSNRLENEWSPEHENGQISSFDLPVSKNGTNIGRGIGGGQEAMNRNVGRCEWKKKKVLPEFAYLRVEKMWTIRFPSLLLAKTSMEGSRHVHQSFVPCFWYPWLSIC